MCQHGVGVYREDTDFALIARTLLILAGGDYDKGQDVLVLLTYIIGAMREEPQSRREGTTLNICHLNVLESLDHRLNVFSGHGMKMACIAPSVRL
jgi:hypothetical protein